MERLVCTAWRGLDCFSSVVLFMQQNSLSFCVHVVNLFIQLLAHCLEASFWRLQEIRLVLCWLDHVVYNCIWWFLDSHERYAGDCWSLLSRVGAVLFICALSDKMTGLSSCWGWQCDVMMHAGRYSFFRVTTLWELYALLETPKLFSCLTFYNVFLFYPAWMFFWSDLPSSWRSFLSFWFHGCHRLLWVKQRILMLSGRGDFTNTTWRRLAFTIGPLVYDAC
jgi:hypothetical protein